MQRYIKFGLHTLKYSDSLFPLSPYLFICRYADQFLTKQNKFPYVQIDNKKCVNLLQSLCTSPSKRDVSPDDSPLKVTKKKCYRIESDDEESPDENV